MLTDNEYVTQVKNTIKSVQHKYQNESKQMIWEMVKFHVKEFSIQYGQEKARKERDKVKALEQKLLEIERELEHSNRNIIKVRKSQIVAGLEQYYLEKAKAAQIRARVTDIEDGEKNTKYFLSLEKNRQENNTIHSLKICSTKITGNSRVLREVTSFWENIYKSKVVNDQDIEEYLADISLERGLADKEQEICEGLLTIEECNEALKNMKSNKSPGSDGLPKEFYETFWDNIKHMVIDSLNESFQKGTMTPSQRNGIITLMFKKGDREEMKNWWPISLLNTDYKLAAFSVANRLHKVLAHLINEDQTGYVKNRFIGTNIRLIEDIFDYTSVNNKSGAIIFCDFEKAFDSVENNFVQQVLKKFNFGPQLRQWIRTFYNNITSSVKCNNWISRKFNVERGIRQGCPVSALIFILVTEILATVIRSKRDISGIQIPGAEVKIAQLADDTTLFLESEESIKIALREVKRFGELAGPKINLTKTTGVWLGPMKNSKKIVEGIAWTSDPIKTLGVYFGHDVKEKLRLNWESRIDKMVQCVEQWKRRKLTLLGRITVVKSLILSKVIYLAQVMECPDEYVKKINKVIFNFIWMGKRDKIKRNSMIMCREEGGLNMTNFRLQDKALKAKMLQRILSNQPIEMWKKIPMHYIGQFKSLILHLESCPDKDIFDSVKMPAYYREVISAWYACKKNDKNNMSNVSIRQQIIWGNSKIKCNGRKLWYKSWIRNDIIYVNDIFDEHGEFKEKQLFETIAEKGNIIMEMYVVKNAITSSWKEILICEPCKLKIKHPPDIYLFVKNKKVKISDVQSSKTFHACLININKENPSIQAHWKVAFQEKNIVWSNIYFEKLRNVNEGRIVSFNFKILSNILATPQKLCKWKIEESSLCHLCFSEGTTEHMMLECAYFVKYYKCMSMLLAKMGFHNVCFNMYTLVCGHKANVVEYRTLNLILNIIFFNVYKCWVKVKINRKYVDPIETLVNECKIRCLTDTYGKEHYFVMFTSMLKDYALFW